MLAGNQPDVVRAQITGSILGTSLLGLGLAAVVGGIGGEAQRFDRARAGLLSSMLILVVIALLLPAIFDATQRVGPALATLESLKNNSASAYRSCCWDCMGPTLSTRCDPSRRLCVRRASRPGRRLAALGLGHGAGDSDGPHRAGGRTGVRCVGGHREHYGTVADLPGVIVLALVGTVADLFTATWFARQGKMGLVLNICVGSAIQVALVVAPLLVLVSWAIGHPMTLVFNSALDLFAIVCAAFIVNSVARDGETTWFEGVLLIGVYLLFGLAFFYVV